ncbi:hypothetical protein Ctob_013126 [Chrysochromulina tobinii]|uniref:Uncharacterized protein n=1 Tax=Chrysochromulina tobinii TaxID=1460289 RepID=A0A0M0K302_9EUKA|nr:hypothetical protein Ctob_013126 [Chrysochromulina tobinii]|eukprot:KOO32947.1 hypothetical protein Ctob_013126 [Chrysochromulina sp. CCMP291]
MTSTPHFLRAYRNNRTPGDCDRKRFAPEDHDSRDDSNSGEAGDCDRGAPGSGHHLFGNAAHDIIRHL